ncbi:putative bifunctional diguanylate cyclase/phosphodiesterase [Actinoplanes sp. CA-030573]|uniref:putative bifunctional diguanylate cyclase/phosphodiesterase n=1 Tax=Actinoplanes sp. CA-030573 TaxID=3239898 RepID=UPI003D94CEB1
MTPWRALARDPLLRFLALWSLLAVVLLVAASGDAGRQAQILWVAQPPMDLVFAWCSWRVQAGTGGATRRFWRVMAAAAALFVVGDSIQAVQSLADPAGALTAGLTQSALLAVGQLAVTVTMLTHPVADRGRTRLARWLDSATVLVGGTIVACCFIAGPSGRPAAAPMAAGIVAAVAAFAAVKMVLSGNGPMHRAAAAPMVAAALLLGAGLLVIPMNDQASTVMVAVQLLASPLIAAGPRIQQLLLRDAAKPFGPRRRKPYSLAPYASVIVVFLALVITLPDGASTRVWISVAGAIAVVALVVARQLVAFQDNAALIDELRRHETRLRDQALYDGLTKLANRVHFADEVAGAMAAGPVSLLLVDLDHFKTVNDTMGHATGDALLVEVAGRLRSAVRETDLVARLGGDEFAVLVTGGDADGTAERIVAELGRPFPLLHNDATVGCSVGVAGSDGAKSQTELMSHADIAMYEAKSRGRATWVRYTPALGGRIRRTADLAARMRDALDSDQFRLVFQPIVRLGGGDLVGAETLLRWHAGPELGTVPPDEFIPIAEESGLIVPLGRRVLREACRQLAAWRREFPAAAGMRIGVNVAGRQLREPGFVGEVREALAEAGLTGDSLTIEVTESAVFDDDAAVSALHDLRSLGIAVALDDFGTAASSLGLLLTCPVTALKLDRSFVREITTEARPMAVAHAVSQISAALQFGSVAEGIETPAQAALLREMGYQYGQGFLWSRPVPGDEFAAGWLTAREEVGAIPG